MNQFKDIFGNIIYGGYTIRMKGTEKTYRMKELNGKLCWSNGDEVTPQDNLDKYWEIVKK